MREISSHLVALGLDNEPVPHPKEVQDVDSPANDLRKSPLTLSLSPRALADHSYFPSRPDMTIKFHSWASPGDDQSILLPQRQKPKRNDPYRRQWSNSPVQTAIHYLVS